MMKPGSTPKASPGFSQYLEIDRRDVRVLDPIDRRAPYTCVLRKLGLSEA